MDSRASALTLSLLMLFGTLANCSSFASAGAASVTTCQRKAMRM